MHPVRTGPMIGLIAQLALLATIAATIGLGPAGCLAGAVCALVSAAVLTHGLAEAGSDRLRPGDRVTLARLTLIGAVTALTADAFTRPTPVPVLVTLSVVALIGDAVDGQVARRTGTASALGARFDMESDAFLIFVLSVYAARSYGWWVLAIGAARYAYVAAGWCLPWLRGTLPARHWRKVVAATAGIVLTGVAADILAHPWAEAVLGVATVLLAESFGRDVWWLWRHRVRPRASTPLNRSHLASVPINGNR